MAFYSVNDLIKHDEYGVGKIVGYDEAYFRIYFRDFGSITLTASEVFCACDRHIPTCPGDTIDEIY